MLKVISLIFSLVAMVFSIPYASADSLNDAGRAAYVSGDVYVVRGGERLPLAEGDSLFSADTVMTGSKGRATLQMNDESKIHVGRLSRIDLSNYTLKEKSLISGAFNMLWGRVRFLVSKLSDGAEFKVGTKTAVLGVRGTEFVVIVAMPEGIVDPTTLELPPNPPDLITTVYGIEGLVEGFSSTGERILIGPGMKVEFTNDGQIKFTSRDKPVSLPNVKPGTTPPPSLPDVPKPEDIRTPPPPPPPQPPGGGFGNPPYPLA